MKNSVADHISELLYLHDCVIVPKFGGFVGNNTSARIDQNEEDIYPPSKKILFNKNLKTNDGLLSSKIALSENLSNEESLQKISLFVEDITDKLKSNKTYRLDKIGLFSLNTENNIMFLQDSTSNYNINSFGMTSQKAKKQLKIENEIKTLIDPAFNKKRIWRAAAVLAPIVGLSILSITQESKIENVYHQMANLNPMELFISNNTESKKVENNITPNIISNDLTINNQENIQDIISEETEKDPSFYIIAGSFNNRINAENLVQSLKKENYNASIVGKNKNGLIRVCFDSFLTKEEASASLQSIKQNNKSAWILSL